MDSGLTIQKIKKAGSFCVMAVFIALIWLPTLDSFFHLDHAPTPNEKRRPAEFPELKPGLTGLREFIRGAELYFNDHFGFRKRLIRLNSQLKHKLFNESPLPDVIVGQDGWLYYAGDRMIDNYCGMDHISPAQLAEWKDLLETRRSWLARRGIKYLFVIAPNKESIYPEHLPEWLSTRKGETKLDHLVSYMKANSTVEVLDLRPVLAEAKKRDRTYLITDSHWNLYGGFAASRQVIDTLGRHLGGLKPLPLKAYERTYTEQHGGDLAVMLGQEHTMRESALVQFAPKPPLRPLEIKDYDLFSYQRMPREKRPVYTEHPSEKYRIVVFRDSFAGAWIPFLGQSFSRAVYIFQHNWNPALLEREKPDAVVDEIVEREFNDSDPCVLKKKDALPY